MEFFLKNISRAGCIRRNGMDAPKTCRAGGRAVGNSCREQAISAEVMANWGLGNTARERGDMAGQKSSSREKSTNRISQQEKEKEKIGGLCLLCCRKRNICTRSSKVTPRVIEIGQRWLPRPSLYRKRRWGRGNSGKESFISTVALESRNLIIRRTLLINGNRKSVPGPPGRRQHNKGNSFPYFACEDKACAPPCTLI